MEIYALENGKMIYCMDTVSMSLVMLVDLRDSFRKGLEMGLES